MDTLFGTSVKAAVESSLAQRRPLIVFLSKGDEASEEFLAKIVTDTSSPIIRDKFVPLILLEDTEEFQLFKQLFNEVVLPSLYIVNNGTVVDIIKEDVSADVISSRLERISPQTQQASQNMPSQQSHQAVNDSRTPFGMETSPLAASPSASTGSSIPSTITENEVDDRLKLSKERQRLYKEEQRTERDRIRALLESDRRERLSKKKHSTSLQKRDTKKTENSSTCVLSIKLLDGKSVVHKFDANVTLQSVRNWLEEETNGEILPVSPSLPSFARSVNPQAVNYVFHLPVIPRKTFTEEEELMKLSDLDLLPRSALILKPIYAVESEETNDGRGFSVVGTVKAVGSKVNTLAHALYSFFDYGVDASLQDDSSNMDTNSISSSRMEQDPFEAATNSSLETRPGGSVIGEGRQGSSSLINVQPESFLGYSHSGVTSQESLPIRDPINRSESSTPKSLGNSQSLGGSQLFPSKEKAKNASEKVSEREDSDEEL